MSRYKTALSSTLSGVWMSSRIGRAVTNPTSIITKPLMSAISIAVCTEAWTFSLSRWPMYVAMTTFAPTEMPRNRLRNMLMTADVQPTAAWSWLVANWPRTAMSTALNSCWRMLLSASGSANRTSFPRSGPCSMST